MLYVAVFYTVVLTFCVAIFHILDLPYVEEVKQYTKVSYMLCVAVF